MRIETITLILGLVAVPWAAPTGAQESKNPVCIPAAYLETHPDWAKPGRPDAYTRGIDPAAGVQYAAAFKSASAAPSWEQPLFMVRMGRPAFHTRGIHPGMGVEAKMAVASEPENTVTKAKSGRPEAYTRGVDPNAAQQIACPLLAKPPLS